MAKTKKITLKVHFAHAKEVSNEEAALTLIDVNKGIVQCSKPPVFFKFSQAVLDNIFREPRITFLEWPGPISQRDTETQSMAYDLYSGTVVYLSSSESVSNAYGKIDRSFTGYRYDCKYGYQLYRGNDRTGFKITPTPDLPTLDPQQIGYRIENPPALVEHLAKGRCSVTNLAKGEMILKTSVFDQGYAVQLDSEFLLLMTKAAEELVEGHSFQPLPKNLTIDSLIQHEVVASQLAGESAAAAGSTASTDAVIIE